MEPNLDEQFLDEKLETLEKARTWPPRLISKLETFIRTADDFALFRVNPLRFGLDRNIPESETIDLFLYSAKIGLFQMAWNLMCPSCGSPVNSFAELSSLHADYYCARCDLNAVAGMDDYIQVAFTISPLVRPIIFHHPETLPFEDYAYKYHFHRGARLQIPGTPEMAEMAAMCQRFGAYLQPGESATVELDLQAGDVMVYDFDNDLVTHTLLEGEPAGPHHVQVTLWGGRLDEVPETLTPGHFTYTFANQGSKRSAIALILRPLPPPGAPFPGLEFEPFLTGNRLINTQTFRDLFRSEVIQSGDGLSVKDLTVLFTDLKGSTALYERIGDLNAFSLVRQHFDSLGTVVKANSGAVVKTIGDAVMATFIDPRDAVKAALQFLDEIEQLNRRIGSKDVIIKIGLHRGASIAVTLNERLDYFGQTVNIAARVQGLADAEEIYLTDTIYDSDGVSDLLAGYQVTPSDARLRGIERGMRVYKINYRAAG